MSKTPQKRAVAVGAVLLTVLAMAAPAQALESSGLHEASTSAVGGAAESVAVDQPTRVINEARDVAEGTESATGSAVSRLDDGAAQARDRVSSTVTDVSASVQATVNQVDAAGTRVTGMVGGSRSKSNQQASPAGHARGEEARDSTSRSTKREHRRDRETAADGPERAALATSSTAQRGEAESRVAPSGETGSAPPPRMGASDVLSPSPGRTPEGSSVPWRSADAPSATSRSAAEPLAAGERRQVARTAAYLPPATPSADRPATWAAWAPAPGSAAASASFLLAFLLLAGMLRPPGLGRRLSPFSASAAPVLFLAALERPG